MDRDLVKRLREEQDENYCIGQREGDPIYTQTFCLEAADRIEALEAENARLREGLACAGSDIAEVAHNAEVSEMARVDLGRIVSDIGNHVRLSEITRLEAAIGGRMSEQTEVKIWIWSSDIEETKRHAKRILEAVLEADSFGSLPVGGAGGGGSGWALSIEYPIRERIKLHREAADALEAKLAEESLSA